MNEFLAVFEENVASSHVEEHYNLVVEHMVQILKPCF